MPNTHKCGKQWAYGEKLAHKLHFVGQAKSPTPGTANEGLERALFGTIVGRLPRALLIVSSWYNGFGSYILDIPGPKSQN